MRIKVIDTGDNLEVEYKTYRCRSWALIDIGKKRVSVPYTYDQQEDSENNHLGTTFNEAYFDEAMDVDGNPVKFAWRMKSDITDAIAKALGG
jgi:hypothetical protein